MGSMHSSLKGREDEHEAEWCLWRDSVITANGLLGVFVWYLRALRQVNTCVTSSQAC